MRTLTVAGAAICLLVLVRESTGGMHAQTTPPQSAPPTSQADGRGTRPAGSAAAADPAADGATDAGQGRELRHRSALHARTRTDGEGRRAAGHRSRVHDGLEGQQDLSRASPGTSPGQSCPYTRQVAVYVPAQYVAGTPAPFIVAQDGMSATLPQQSAADPRQPHSREARAADGRRHGAQRRRRRPGQRTRAGVRHGLGRLHRFHRDGSAPANHQGLRHRLHQGSRGPRDDGREFGRGVRIHDGLVPSRALSPGALLLRDLRQPAVAAQSRVAAWRVGISRDAHSRALPPSRSASGCT